MPPTAEGVEITLGNALDQLPDITDPVQRAWACEDLLKRRIPEFQAAVASIRRKAIYEATLRPGSTPETVAAEFGVTDKAISKAVSEQRAADRELLRAGLEAARHATALSPREVDAATTTRDVPLMARRLLWALAQTNFDALTSEELDTVRQASARAEDILKAHFEETG